MRCGSQSMVAPLQRVIVKRPQEAYRNQFIIQEQFQELNYVEEPDMVRAVDEHAVLVRLLESFGAEVLTLPVDDRTGLDSIYTHDPGIVTDAGAILFKTGKLLRRGEGPAMADAMRRWDIPVLGMIEGEATAEGGDMIWLNSSTLLVGHGFRTNAAGIDALRNLLTPLHIRVIEFHLPYWNGPADVLHLMSFVSLLDADLAVIYRRLMPAPLFELLSRNGIQMIDIAEQEYYTLGCNVLALAPREVLMAEGNPVTRSRLETAGCRVREFPGHEIALKGSGGPTCLTRPVSRG